MVGDDQVTDGCRCGDGVAGGALPVELRPDLVLAEGERGSWAMVEVQLEVDEAKQRRWPLAAALLFDARGVMGDLVVLTSQRSVAEWASDVGSAGPLGTRLGLRPLVVLLSGETVDALLTEEHPELGFFAAWAMRERHGPRAQEVVTRALELAAELPEDLQAAQVRAIFNVLGEKMLTWLRETAVDPQMMPESPAYRAWREEIEAEGEARGELRAAAQAVLAVLAARQIEVDEAARERVLSCTDRDTLGQWLVRAATATSLDQMFAKE